MNSRTFHSMLLIAVTGVLGARTWAGEGEVSGSLGASLDSYLSGRAALGLSCSILVAKDGKVVLRAGYGFADRDKEVP